jgi:hypothetical protein
VEILTIKEVNVMSKKEIEDREINLRKRDYKEVRLILESLDDAILKLKPLDGREKSIAASLMTMAIRMIYLDY